MKAVDTNVVVRFLTNDDRQQSAAARSLFASGPVWIAKTVWLETAWVLNKLYRFEENAIVAAFAGLLGLAHVHTDSKNFIASAITLTSAGVDFADAIHLSDKPAGATFVSFDEKLVRRAKRAGVTEISGL